MYIRSIELRNWKGYAHAKLEFPKPGQKKNVVLIGANNGYGKTSLLEAFILCLYGQEGVWTLPRAGSKGEQSQSYNDFLERALHAVARDRGDMSCSVLLLPITVLQTDAERSLVNLWMNCELFGLLYLPGVTGYVPCVCPTT